MTRTHSFRRLLAAVFATAALFGTGRAGAQGIPPIFSDTEIEQTIRTFCRPIWIAAGLNPDDVRIILVNDPEIQAFVAGGQNIFIFTGLLAASDNPSQIIGVVAHETGHIAGGHLARSDEDMADASYTMLLATVLGAAAAAGSKDPGAMAGALGIGEDMGIRSYLAFSRTKEASADAAALTFLETAHMSPQGLLDFMKKIQVEEGVPITGDNKYLIDHPPTQERVEAIAEGLGRSHYVDAKLPPEWTEMYARMKAKLIGYLQPERALRKYSRADNSQAGRYGRSIALWRSGEIDSALKLIDGLIAEEPNNVYFYHAKAQMLFANGRIADSIPPFKRAAALAPKDTAEIHTEYAQALLERENPSVLATAIDELKIARHADERDPELHRFLAIAYGRQGNEAVAKVELAEQAILEGRTRDGRLMAVAAMRMLPAGSRDWLRAQDLLATSKQRKHSSDDDSSGIRFSAGPATER